MGRLPRYSKQFKREAVLRLMESPELSVAEIAAELGIKPDRLYHWRAEFLRSGEVKPVKGETAEQEVVRLRKELQEVRRERDFLKKAAAFFARDPE